MSASGEGTELGRTIWQELDAWARALAPWQKYILAAAIRDGELNFYYPELIASDAGLLKEAIACPTCSDLISG